MNFPLHLSCLGSTQIYTMLSNTQIFIEYFMRKVIIRITAHYGKQKNIWFLLHKHQISGQDQRSVANNVNRKLIICFFIAGNHG